MQGPAVEKGTLEKTRDQRGRGDLTEPKSEGERERRVRGIDRESYAKHGVIVFCTRGWAVRGRDIGSFQSGRDCGEALHSLGEGTNGRGGLSAGRRGSR
jgi:hypothetical protein